MYTRWQGQSPGSWRAQHEALQPPHWLWACVSQLPSVSSSGALKHSQETSGLTAFPCHFHVSSRQQEEEVGGGKGAGGTGAHFVRPCEQSSLGRDPHIKGSIYVFIEGPLEVTQMLLKGTVAITEGLGDKLPMQPAPASPHTGPERAPAAPVTPRFSGVVPRSLQCPRNSGPAGAADTSWQSPTP